ncbi:MAG: ArsR/SmtB family transcription factor [Planctomycetota bacterium]|jgi:DNA-binding transcriptional ArsR family regulator
MPKNNTDVCSVYVFDKKKVKAMRKGLPKTTPLEGMTTTFKAMAHPSRLTILHVLARRECCVCEIAEILGHPVSTVSQHLRVLKTARLLKSRQEGKLVHYSLARPDLKELIASCRNLTSAPKSLGGRK